MNEVTTIANDLETDKYGILPFCKWDSDQLEYHTALRDSLSAVSVPTNVQDLEMAGVITEALCMYGYQIVRPEYLNNVIGNRYMTDNNLKKMMEICRESVTVDFIMVYNSIINTPYSTMDTIVAKGTSYATFYAGKYGTWNKNLATIYESLGVSKT